jgi:hypothetical protein
VASCFIKIEEMECLSRLMMDHPVFGVVGGSGVGGDVDPASSYLQRCEAR